ncbi:hypothetical protein ABES02_00600 [Neobacillus pocheonensis]|uniref:YfjL-like protein n=1 Tax=Neobacillus pocheonensis TaxID=363869 RepID=UPI003D2C85AD
MKLKKIIIAIILIAIIVIIGYFLNGLFGNPISKSIAEKEVLTYFEEKYNKDFQVYSSNYNFLIPDYNIKMGPSDDQEVVFETSRYELKRFDSYGAYLAQEELKSRMLEIIAKDYPEIKFTLQVEEQHDIDVAGVEFAFFASNPQIRLEKNYFSTNISWVDTGLSNDETIMLMDEIALKINNELKGIPKELALDISVKDKKSGEEIFYRFYVKGKAIIKD